MESIDLLTLASRWAHISAAIVAIGGAAFQLLALRPASESVLDAEEHARLRDAIRVRWSRIVFGCIFVLLLTGFANFYFLVLAPKIPPKPYHWFFGPKVLLAFFVFFIASALAGRSPGLARMRAKSSTWLALLIVLGAAIVLVSGLLSQIRAGAGS
ncbi:MAG: hypothetical protein IH989_08605 [Planctomycetes bacterium]|nr:hypothetical protein [Planctomycetota bacterium]